MLPWQSSKSFGCIENELVAQLSLLGLPKRAELKTWLALIPNYGRAMTLRT
ncbi:hypothetical protein ALO37_200190 [Pseudomonas savastanoi pv. glycinea]|nr:hypothetical protein ALO37_200190 [Pseudomonas savastanoi pv. glycinea]